MALYVQQYCKNLTFSLHVRSYSEAYEVISYRKDILYIGWIVVFQILIAYIKGLSKELYIAFLADSLSSGFLYRNQYEYGLWWVSFTSYLSLLFIKTENLFTLSTNLTERQKKVQSDHFDNQESKKKPSVGWSARSWLGMYLRVGAPATRSKCLSAIEPDT